MIKVTSKRGNYTKTLKPNISDYNVALEELRTLIETYKSFAEDRNAVREDAAFFRSRYMSLLLVCNTLEELIQEQNRNVNKK